MITAIKWGAMYGMFEDCDVLRPEVVQLGDSLIIPGDRIEFASWGNGVWNTNSISSRFCHISTLQH